MSTSGPTSFAEYELPSPPQDPVSALAFNPNHSADKARQLLVSSWDRLVRFYDLTGSTDTNSVRLLKTFQHDAPVLDVCWINDGLAASGGVDRRVRLLNLETGQSRIIGKHNQAVSRLRFSPATGLLLTGSWDRTIKIWDPFNVESGQALLKTLEMPDKVLAMDLSPPFPSAPMDARSVSASANGATVEPDRTPRAVIAMTGRTVHIYELNRIKETLERVKKGEEVEEKDFEPDQRRESSLKFMLRDVKCMPAGDGYATSSVEGRIAVELFDPTPESQSKKYAFKCHRQNVDGIDTVYPVNCMSFHPVHGTFASLGGDAVCSIWDAAAKKRIRQYPRLPSPLSASCFSSDGAVLAIASGAENIEDTRHQGPGAGEVGEVGRGGEGNVRIHIKPAWEDCKPKLKTSA
ncbi:WD40 repeat-like protein [Violaceomyces palustris]|uniref:WD40 repeat-like protein n=1 Tax=Violaceomyces palustris TaxID=1673888 RepID=A0ACD0P1N5_9BASI|nr:WD40 repeat-like protein [Violaceomyces palustris]